jgi:hypothetical protein
MKKSVRSTLVTAISCQPAVDFVARLNERR